MEKNITVRAAIEVLGKPQAHVEETLKGYVQKLREDKRYAVISEEFAEARKQEENDYWAAFVDLEIKTANLQQITQFCFEYMPSVVEIVQPKELKLSDVESSTFFNDLQARLHEVDMIAKHVKLENDHYRRNMAALLKNYVTLLLRGGNMTSETLSHLTGVAQNKLEDFLDQLIDEGRIDLKEGIYFLIEKSIKKEETHGAKS